MFGRIMAGLIWITAVSSASLRGAPLDLNEELKSIVNDDTHLPMDEKSVWNLFASFQDKFEKKYATISELHERFDVFKSNVHYILEHNSDATQNFTMGINQFTDLTAKEFKESYVHSSIPLGSYGCKPYISSTTSGTSIDWRTKNVVNAVRDQGQCGSCWAFATTANAESVWAISKGQLLDLSEQYLVDCASGTGYFNMGCNGGMPDSAFKYMINNDQCSEASYPYVSGTTKTAGTCHSCSKVTTFSACYDVTPNDQVALKSAVTKNPVVVAIEADTRYFQSYSSGILTDTKCGTNLDHAVEIVGYGVDNGIKYWNVRNSWSASWGESGYVRIARSDSTNDIGICGIAAEPSFIAI
jgi:KDEL-tailed cysteine endopeptidase